MYEDVGCYVDARMKDKTALRHGPRTYGYTAETCRNHCK